DDCRLSLVGERRTRAPQGAHAGEPGALGRNLLNGEELPAKVSRDLAAGDLVRVETPGGGGFGRVQNGHYAGPSRCARTIPSRCSTSDTVPFHTCAPAMPTV